jgi:acyl-CoA thioester hydrolase
MMFHPPATIRDGAHHYAVRVYYEDTDAGGVVYHANFLRFAERARTEALRDLGVSHAEMADQHGLMFMVRRVKLDYLKPARLDDSLVVVTRPLEIRLASIDLRQCFVRQQISAVEHGEGGLAVLEVRLACVTLANPRPMRIPARWREALQGMDGRENASFGAQ